MAIDNLSYHQHAAVAATVRAGAITGCQLAKLYLWYTEDMLELLLLN